MRSDASTVEDYLAALPADRREIIARVREVVLDNLPAGYEEAMAFGMIGYGVPLARYPKTYNHQPLAYAALASQKNYCALYLMGVYADPDLERSFRERWAASGRKLDMGKSCLRFRQLADLDLELIGEVIAATPVDELIAAFERSRR